MSCRVNQGTLVVIDCRVPDLETLSCSLGADARAVTSNILLPFAQTAAVVESADKPPAALHLVAHGAPGVLYLGNETLTADNIAGHAEDLARIGRGMAPEGVIALTACEVADGPEGQALLDALAAATGCRVTGTKGLVLSLIHI